MTHYLTALRFFVFSLVFMAAYHQTKAKGFKEFDRKEFYRILKSGTISEINDEIALLQSSGLVDKDAFEGTLLMKKAGLADKPKDKLNFFKSGRIKLETAINNDSGKVEYRFMRLIIQEHAPKAVKYQAQITSDSAYIKENFKTAQPELQQVIVDYSKNSKALQQKDFQSS